MINPKGHRMLVKPYVPENKSKGGIILAQSVQDANAYLANIGQVVAQGATCYTDESFEGERWCDVGDYIQFTKHAGVACEVLEGANYVKYRILNDKDVLSTVDDPSKVRIYS